MQPILGREFEILDLQLSNEHVVDDLRHDGPREARSLAEAEHFQDLPRSVVRDGPRTNLARVEQGGYPLERVFHRRPMVGGMQIVDIEIVRTAPLQALFASSDETLFLETLGASPDPAQTDLAGDEERPAAFLDGPPDDTFRLSRVVNVRRVEQGDAALLGGRDDPRCLRFGRTLA